MNTKQQPMPVDLAESAWCYHVGRDDAKKLWAAMLAAAPQPLPLHNAKVSGRPHHETEKE